MDHLEELRKHIIRSVVAILIMTIIAAASMDLIFHYVLLAPTRPDFWTYRMLCKLGEGMCIDKIEFNPQNLSMAGQITTHIVASIITGAVAAFPYVFWQIWKFIKPGLHPNERKNAGGTVFYVTILFVIGVLFGFYVLAPLSVNFLLTYTLDPSIHNLPEISSYISFIGMLVLGSGIMFQLPVAIYILTRMGIVGPSFLRKYRKQAIVVIFIIAAIFTPSPDFFTQSVVALPLYLLFELSIFISAGVAKRKEQEELNQVKTY